jgi:hypothetical protein
MWSRSNCAVEVTKWNWCVNVYSQGRRLKLFFFNILSGKEKSETLLACRSVSLSDMSRIVVRYVTYCQMLRIVRYVTFVFRYVTYFQICQVLLSDMSRIVTYVTYCQVCHVLLSDMSRIVIRYVSIVFRCHVLSYMSRIVVRYVTYCCQICHI